MTHTRSKALHWRVLLGVLLLTGTGFSSSGSAQVIDVEITLTIRNSEYLLTKWVPPLEGSMVNLTIKNEDHKRHGFQSEFFHNHLVTTDIMGVQVYGKGIEGLYIDPGKTVRLQFQVDRQGNYQFKCDIHPSMKGELLLLHVDVA